VECALKISTFTKGVGDNAYTVFCVLAKVDNILARTKSSDI